MSYSFCFGPSGSGKSTCLRRMMIRRAQASMARGGKDRTKYIFVVPEQYSMQTQRELVQEHPSHVLMNIDVLSFGRLAYRVFEETGADPRTVLNDTGKSLLLRRVASRCEDSLQILRRGIHRPGMIDEIKSILSEFMQYGIGEREMEAMAAYAAEHGQNALRARLEDIRKLYDAFREEQSSRYVTAEETMDLLARAIPGAQSLRGAVVVFDGFTGFTTVQYRVVMALMHCAREVIFSFSASQDMGPDVAVTAAGGPAGSEEDLFYLTRRTIADLIRMADQEGIRRGQDLDLVPPEEPSGASVLPRFRDSRVLAHLERSLFRYPETAFEETRQGETGDSLRLFAASTPQEEVRQIFARIRRIIARTGCAYRDFAIVTADLETYGDLFELEAVRSRVPVYIDRTSGAFHNILIEGIRSVLQISADNFSRESVFRYLRSGLSGVTAEETDRLENYCLANGVRGRKRWAAPFDASCEEARRKFLLETSPVTGLVPSRGQEADPLQASAQDEQTGGEGPDRADPNVDGTGASGTDRTQTDAAVGAGASEDAPARRRARTVGERTREVYGFLTACGAQARMDETAARFDEEGDVVRQKQYSQIYRTVIDLLDQVYALAGEERISARDYLELLEAGFSQIRLGTLPQRVDRILVGDMERTRLTQIRHLFFAGANEGNIPRSASRGGILSDMDREFLAAGGAVLAPTPRQQMFSQRLYLYLNMTKPSESLTVSFAKESQDGKGLRPSYLISSLRALFPRLEVELPELLPARDQVFGQADGLRLLAGGLRSFAAGFEGADASSQEDFRLLYGFFTSPEVSADPGIREAVCRLREAALYRYRPVTLPEAAEAVYGTAIRGGISRMETAAKCMLWHHLQYGLHLLERDRFELGPVDEGTVLHGALQRFDGFLRAEGLSWKDFTREDASRLALRALREQAAVYRNFLLYNSARDRQMIGRYARRLLRTVDTLQYQIRKGDLLPAASELGFGTEGSALPAIRYDLGGGRGLRLVGRIDRVDLYDLDQRRYLRIMDYKTGPHDLNPDLVRRGLQLQLITYMNALMKTGAGLRIRQADAGNTEMEGEKDAQAGPGGAAEAAPPECVPSAMLYYRMDDPVLRLTAEDLLRENTERDAETEMIRVKLRPTGLVYGEEETISHLDRNFEGASSVIPVKRLKNGCLASVSRVISPEGFRDLSRAAEEALCGLAHRILDGDAAASPAMQDDKTIACAWCPYREVCGYDPRVPGFAPRRD